MVLPIMVVNNHQFIGFISHAMKQPITYMNKFAINKGNNTIQITLSIALISYITFFYKDKVNKFNRQIKKG